MVPRGAMSQAASPTSAKRKSRAGDFARLDARGAHIHALGGCADLGPHPLDIGVPAPLGAPMRVGDVVPETGTLAADIAGGSHGALLDFQPRGHELPGSIDRKS